MPSPDKPSLRMIILYMVYQKCNFGGGLVNKDELEKLLGKHRLWIDGKEGGERLDLSGKKLRRADFSDCDLKGSIFREVEAIGVDFSGADLENTSFENANVTNANFENCNLKNINICGAKMDGINLEGAIIGKGWGACVGIHCIWTPPHGDDPCGQRP
jgi:hypothetical protein